MILNVKILLSNKIGFIVGTARNLIFIKNKNFYEKI